MRKSPLKPPFSLIIFSSYLDIPVEVEGPFLRCAETER